MDGDNQGRGRWLGQGTLLHVALPLANRHLVRSFLCCFPRCSVRVLIVMLVFRLCHADAVRRLSWRVHPSDRKDKGTDKEKDKAVDEKSKAGAAALALDLASCSKDNSIRLFSMSLSP